MKSIDHENNETVTFNLVRSIIIFYLCALQIASCTTIQGTRFSSRDETLPPQIPPTREIFTELQSLGGSSWTRIHPALTCTRTLARCTRNWGERGYAGGFTPRVKSRGRGRGNIRFSIVNPRDSFHPRWRGSPTTARIFPVDEGKKTWYFRQGFVLIPSSMIRFESSWKLSSSRILKLVESRPFENCKRENN